MNLQLKCIKSPSFRRHQKTWAETGLCH